MKTNSKRLEAEGWWGGQQNNKILFLFCFFIDGVRGNANIECKIETEQERENNENQDKNYKKKNIVVSKMAQVFYRNNSNMCMALEAKFPKNKI